MGLQLVLQFRALHGMHGTNALFARPLEMVFRSRSSAIEILKAGSRFDHRFTRRLQLRDNRCQASPYLSCMRALLRLTGSSGLLLAMHLFAAAAEPAAQAKVAKRQHLARVEFNPGGGPSRGEAAFQGASWSALGPGPGKGNFMQARAGIGDRFPVRNRAGVTLFEIELENGVDDHLVVQITGGDVDQKVRLPRDKRVEITIAGVKYALTYPTTQVAAEAGERPSTNKATIFVTQTP